MSQDDATRFQLPTGGNRRIGIPPWQLTGPTPQIPAIAVFLIGQPGAGKTPVAQLAAAQLDRRGGFAEELTRTCSTGFRRPKNKAGSARSPRSRPASPP
ncbi:zeta toxin family protein [Streptomyces recifensis]|uniref:zeta toxin family protein n=1 Tax=Streptomyces recifensis TaxID=67355 RepID=UPI003CC5A3F0